VVVVAEEAVVAPFLFHPVASPEPIAGVNKQGGRRDMHVGPLLFGELQLELTG